MERIRVLLVGLEYPAETSEEWLVETRGLCETSSFPMRAARPLYDYDVVIINPESYSHFMFGQATAHSDSPKELWDLKAENNGQDLDNCFRWYEREKELEAAMKNGTRVIWIVTPDKRIHFFGERSLYSGYVDRQASEILKRASLSSKSSKRLGVQSIGRTFQPYFDKLIRDGWKVCWEPYSGQTCEQRPLAVAPDGYWLGAQVTTDSGTAWMLTPPPTSEALVSLIRCAVNLDPTAVKASRYHGIFLSHNHEDKPFVRKLRDALHQHGVADIWVDESEIMVGDSLIHKIQEGIEKSEYFGVVLSPRSVESSWVQRELEVAMSLEIGTRSVKVLPLLLEECRLPSFLRPKLYADFTSDSQFESELQMLLRRLERHA